ncbi:CBASS cGAMP-activated phospholipase [Sphaerotilus sp.]|uniref:CBASS cGAMP-activated phospholipase n=1 Tax=Sphaerotilus sp. TaxID=2093942 RepID=UPI002ACDECFB|nr:CBASS cGAMP-activated phospholipase [Sphaerotilus sp.]MDZ7854774.1 CBASS cGAMP-activated phospholipase [Sphaerotilus sp.]
MLALSGGGYRGLYTAKILADLEQEIGGPIAQRFDLIAGTSIGGILALAVAMEIPAEQMVRLFEQHGQEIFRRRLSLWGILRAPYSPEPLKQLLSEPKLFGEQTLGVCKHPVIVPAINYSTGQPQLFKTPHHSSFKRDHRFRLVDIALATSAAPGYFPRHTFNNNQYVDGGLYANAPGLLALHEAQTFLGQPSEAVHMMSIGTMSSKFTADPRRNRSGGTYDWGGFHPANMPKRLFGLSISVQESLSDFMLKHRLGARYVPIDDVLTDERARAVALDIANAPAREVLIGAASEKSKASLGRDDCQSFLRHRCATPKFYCGPNAVCEIQC